MKLRELEILNAILQTGSVTAAAKLLNVSQPSVSTILQHTESQLGMQLFERAGGRLKPSPEALALLPGVRDIFRRVERVSENARSLARGRLGRINIAGTLALANGYIVDAVSVFLSRYPGVDITIHSLQTPDIIERVVAKEIDLGLCYGGIINGALQVEELTARAMVCVMPDGHRLARKAAVEISDLVLETLITYEDGDWLRKKVDALLGALEVAPHLSLQVSQTVTAIRLVAEGAGLALVEPFFFAATRPQGLVAKPVVPAQNLSVEMIRVAGAVESAAMGSFVEILRTVARAS